MQKFIVTISLFIFSTCLFGQGSRENYIEKYKSIAVKKMLEHGIPASITLAQGILESGSGLSTLAVNANNHFGIKCHNDWNGNTFIMDDDERNECFRKYTTPEQSFEDHSLFLTTRDRYAFLFEYDVTDYKKWAHGLKKAGYATNPQYAQLLIKVIEDNHLDRFDKIKNLNELGAEETIYAETKPTSKHPEYLDPNVEDFHPVSISTSNRIIYESNGVKYVLALQQDSWDVIAEEFGFYTKQILDFNSANKKTPLNPGDRVYIERKNKKAEVMYHIVQYGETLQSISQKYAVRVKNIRKRNNMKRSDELIAGQRLALR